MNIIEHNKAIESLKNDDVVGMPTETVYGLAGSIYSEVAFIKFLKLKKDHFLIHLLFTLPALMMQKLLEKGLNQQRFWHENTGEVL